MRSHWAIKPAVRGCLARQGATAWKGKLSSATRVNNGARVVSAALSQSLTTLCECGDIVPAQAATADEHGLQRGKKRAFSLLPAPLLQPCHYAHHERLAPLPLEDPHWRIAIREAFAGVAGLVAGGSAAMIFW